MSGRDLMPKQCGTKQDPHHEQCLNLYVSHEPYSKRPTFHISFEGQENGHDEATDDPPACCSKTSPFQQAWHADITIERSKTKKHAKQNDLCNYRSAVG